MTHIPAPFRDQAMVSNPTSHLPSIRDFLTRCVAYLNTFLKQNGALSEEDIRLTKEVMVHLCYVEVLFSKIEKIYGDRLTERHDFEGLLSQIAKEFSPYLDGRGMASISLVALMDVNICLEEIIKQVHAPYAAPAGPSLLDQLITWFANKLIHFNCGIKNAMANAGSEGMPSTQVENKKWKPKPFERARHPIAG